MTERLGRSTLPRRALIGASAPARTGIVHLGLGNFHRAHAAVHTARAMAVAGGDWGIRGFAFSSGRVVEPMRAQDHLYSILQLTEDGVQAGVVDVHRDTGIAAEDPAAVVASLADPAHRILTLTISELGYSRDGATGRLAVDDPRVAADLRPGAAPSTGIAMIARGLEARAASGEPFTVVSCDNLQSNGAATRTAVLEFLQAAGASPDVQDYAASAVSFPNTMVDRIVPATTAAHSRRVAELLGVEDACPVPAEDFSMWVMEDDFAGGRPAWEQGGAVFSAEVGAYEMVKLRLLNASHSLIAYLGVLTGRETIAESWNQDFVREAVMGGIRADLLPTFALPSGFDLEAHLAQLSRRWGNPLIGHATAQVGSDGSSKLVQRLTDAALHSLERGGMPHHLALCVAAWIACTVPPAGFDPGPLAERIAEPARERLIEAVRGAAGAQDHARRVLDAGLFPPALAGREDFAARVADLLDVLVRHGARAAAEEAGAAEGTGAAGASAGAGAGIAEGA
ncbi:mannitol dehydrogenase family protein [Brevibacterium album]|uniref:mannitol dehydrogenase family protein n=1 Tax=Brevibacterium album TaxID=417948 RepID=UPI0004101210|nr:mannitol dehydrogenase family protein [Brevibacterium album]